MPKESYEAVSAILNRAISTGKFTNEDKKEIKALLDAEADAAEIEAVALKEVIGALNGYIEETDKELEGAEKELGKIESELTSEVNKATGS